MATNYKKYLQNLITSIRHNPYSYMNGVALFGLLLIVLIIGNPFTEYKKVKEASQALKIQHSPNPSFIIPATKDVAAYLQNLEKEKSLLALQKANNLVKEPSEKAALLLTADSAPDQDPADLAPVPENPPEIINTTIGKGGTLSKTLNKLGLDKGDCTNIINTLAPVYNVRRLRPEHQVIATKTDYVQSIEIRCSVLERYKISRLSKTAPWQAERLNVHSQKIIKTVHGRIASSLYQALNDVGEGNLTTTFADIFSWEIDFFHEVRTGDKFSMVIEKQLVDGQIVSAGTKILAAAYDGAIGKYQAFRQSNDIEAYYDENGNSLRKAFLRAPLQFPRITSSYGNRRHPVLGYSRKHDGVDYGTPINTPVLSVADGTVTFIGNQPAGAGKYVKVRYPNGYEAIFMHLNHIDVKVGQHVKQKQVIAHSGNTGISTGPHLHYGLKKNNKSVNPATEKFPRGNPLNKSNMDSFKTVVAQYQPLLQEKTDTRIITTKSQNAIASGSEE